MSIVLVETKYSKIQEPMLAKPVQLLFLITSNVNENESSQAPVEVLCFTMCLKVQP